MPIGAVDWKGQCLRLNMRKTGKKIYIPLSPAFLKILKHQADVTQRCADRSVLAGARRPL